MSKHIHLVRDDTFEQEVLQQQIPVLVDYWAEWCGPCKAITPVLEEAAEAYADRIKIAKLNVDENAQTPSQYGIRGIPTLMLFKDGKVAATTVGVLSKARLTAFIEAHI